MASFFAPSADFDHEVDPGFRTIKRYLSCGIILRHLLIHSRKTPLHQGNLPNGRYVTRCKSTSDLTRRSYSAAICFLYCSSRPSLSSPSTPGSDLPTDASIFLHRAVHGPTKVRFLHPLCAQDSCSNITLNVRQVAIIFLDRLACQLFESGLTFCNRLMCRQAVAVMVASRRSGAFYHPKAATYTKRITVRSSTITLQE